MTIHLTDAQALAARRHSVKALRDLGLKDPRDFQAHKLEWKTLEEARKTVLRAANEALDGMKGAADDDALDGLDKTHEALMALFDEIEREKDARSQLGDRKPRTDARSPRQPMPEDMEAPGMDDGEPSWTRSRKGSAWRTKGNEEIRVLAPTEKLATDRWEGPTLGECLRAMILGPSNEMERRVLSEGTDSAGGFTVPAPLARIYIDKLRAASVVMRAGAQTVEMTSETLAIARLASDPTFAWRAENAEITASDPTFERVLFTARSLAGLVKTSRELMEDTTNAAAMLENAFVQAAALEFDRAALYGTGSGDDMPEGVGVISGINSVSMGTDGDALTGYDEISDAVYELELDNAPAPTAMIYHPRTGNTLRKLKTGDGLPIVWPTDLGSIPRLTTTSVPINQTQGSSSNASSILIGHWPHMFVGLRSSLRIELLRERYAEYLQYGFVAHMRGDVQLAHKASFCKLIGIVPAGA